jgi:phosphopantothenoylcysteine synthetase/decarboxylase
MRVLITAGGTSERVDDVRVLTNVSRGLYGCALARACHAAGAEVTLLAGAAVADRAARLAPAAQILPFGGVADLDRALHAVLAGPPVDALFMAAAVSDYIPEPISGKVPSDAETWTITLRRAPKLLPTLRDRCGPRTVVVGFKLLSGVDADTLAAVGVAQARRDRLDLTVANDLRDLGDDAHPVTLCWPSGQTRVVTGPRDATAAEVTAAVLERVRARATG